MNGNTTDAADSEARDFLYREYARLAECCNGYVKGALTDIKLLGGIGAVLAWDPVSRMLDLDANLDQPVTPVGFISSEEHTSDLQSLMRISYAVLCLKK